MSERTVWTCDGCDKEIVVTANQVHDWRKVTVTLEGFDGYPIHQGADDERHFHMCAPCRKRLYERANPRFWPRAAESKEQTR